MAVTIERKEETKQNKGRRKKNYGKNHNVQLNRSLALL
jgi:hypothetical protein